MKRIILCVFLFLLFTAILAGIILWREAAQTPEWYRPLDPNDERVAQLAERVEYGLVEEFHKIRPEPDPWTVRVGETHLNAWMASRLPEWVAHDEAASWPEELGVPHLRIGEEGIDLAVSVERGETSRVLVTRLAPEFADGRVRLVVDRVGVGRLGLPGPAASVLLDMIDEIAPDGVIDENAAQQFLGMLSGGEAIDGTIELADGRRIELVDLLLTEGGIEFKNRTLPAAP